MFRIPAKYAPIFPRICFRCIQLEATKVPDFDLCQGELDILGSSTTRLNLKLIRQVLRQLDSDHCFLVAEKLLRFGDAKVARDLKAMTGEIPTQSSGKNAVNLAISIVTNGRVKFQPKLLPMTNDEKVRMSVLLHLAKTPYEAHQSFTHLIELVGSIDLDCSFWSQSSCFQLAFKHILEQSTLSFEEYTSLSQTMMDIVFRGPKNQVRTQLSTIFELFKLKAIVNSNATINAHTVWSAYMPFIEDTLVAERLVQDHDKFNLYVQLLLLNSNDTSFTSPIIEKLLTYGFQPSLEVYTKIIDHAIRHDKNPEQTCVAMTNYMKSFKVKPKVETYVTIIRAFQKGKQDGVFVRDQEREMRRYTLLTQTWINTYPRNSDGVYMLAHQRRRL
jgi:hypothetical protein